MGGDVGAEVLEQRVGNAAEEVDSDVPDAAIEVGRIEKVANELGVLLNLFVLLLLSENLVLFRLDAITTH